MLKRKLRHIGKKGVQLKDSVGYMSPNPHRITVDTNVLVAATISEGPAYQILRMARNRDVVLVLSLEILKEFKEVISRPRFGFSDEQIMSALKQIISISEIVVPTVKINAVKEDPDDNIILETAVSGSVDYLVSRDRHLLDIAVYQKIRIVGPSEFLGLLK